MREYPKIQSVYKRDEETHKFIIDKFSLDEFQYLQHNMWVWTEKIDGTNIRIGWDSNEGKIEIGGRTDNAQIPTFLFKKLTELFTAEKMRNNYPDMPFVLYGEGYGARIQKGGGNYIKNDVSFILFDVLVNDKWWLKRIDVEDVAKNLGIDVVPIVGEGDIKDLCDFVENGFDSTFGSFKAEGVVARPQLELFARNGARIITKVKTKDF